MKSVFSKPGPAAIFMIVALLVDQATKLFIDANLPLQVPYQVLPFLSFYRTYNTGVAFSMLADADGWFIVGLRLTIVIFVLWMWKRTDPANWLAHLGFALVIAGAFGNLIDRFAYGHVIDFVLFHISAWSFAVFNLADSYITIGAMLIGFDELFGGPKQNKDSDA